ncbi:hypothetical protein K440DRAFT_643921 [Wilcoxina mikolae CBS 423.85]|nr:hypothetical protein K440DRAFT_643921 [Wilcoxina mikolae CBS 423.85]
MAPIGTQTPSQEFTLDAVSIVNFLLTLAIACGVYICLFRRQPQPITTADEPELEGLRYDVHGNAWVQGLDGHPFKVWGWDDGEDVGYESDVEPIDLPDEE